MIHHSDKGVQYLAIRYTKRLAGAGAALSVGSTGDSYDNAMAEAFNSLFKAELIRNKGPWRDIDHLEVAVAEYLDWYNHRRLHGEIGLVPPVEHEQQHHLASPRQAGHPASARPALDTPPDYYGPVGTLSASVEALSTERLLLVPLSVADADEMIDVLAHPATYTFIGGGPPTLEALRERYAYQLSGGPDQDAEDWLNWVVRLRASETAIGSVQATVFAHGKRGDVAWVIGTPWQGRRYGSEAAAALAGWLRGRGVQQLTAHVHPDNAASAAIGRHIGLAPTGQSHDGEQRWLWQA